MFLKKSVFLLAGGPGRRSPKPDPLIQTVYRECGVSSPTIAYVGVANDDSTAFFQRMADYFKENGAATVTHAILNSSRNPTSRFSAILERADIVFISGGDVEYGMRVLRERNLTDFLAGLYDAGKSFFGVSAGSIMLARHWVRWPDPAQSGDSAALFPCLGIAPVTCDTHGEEDEFEELQVALELEGDGATGYGIVTGAAIRVSSRGVVSALGSPCYRYVNRSGKITRMDDLTPEC